MKLYLYQNSYNHIYILILNLKYHKYYCKYHLSYYLINQYIKSKDDREIALEAVKNNPEALEFVSDRLKAGLSIDEALNKPVIKSGGKILYTLNDETKLLSEWCQIYNINYQTAWKKSKKGYNIEKILKIEK